MSLSGALESFPVVEVLKLAGRTGKTGVLRVDTQGLEARVYLTEGQLSYGTTRRDEEFHSKLIEAGLVDPKAWVDVERRERSIRDILSEGATREQLNAFMLDQLADVLFRVLRERSGRFAFSEDVAPRFETGVELDVEQCVAEAEERLGRWKEIESVIPGVAFHLRLAPDAADDSPVEIDAQEWHILAGFVGSGTVEEASRQLGWSEFRAAELMAAMVRRNLLVVADHRPEGRYTYGGESSPESESGASKIEVLGPRLPAPPKGADEEPKEEPRQGPEQGPEDGSDGEVLRSALSDIVMPSEQPQPPGLKRRRSLGDIIREAE
ncbi:MAG: DUF4388 domain-containing protein [Actinobacteria bacterium]|nr:DUF4388 domain-containing protein [Actinomycetota bacterium]